MKTIISLVFSALLATPTFASNGGGGSVDNGGEYLALKFTQIGFEAISAMMKLSPNEAILNLQNLKRLEKAATTTRVDAIKGPILDNSGRQVDARFIENDGKPLIEIDEDRWPSFLEDRDTSHRLVIHEYLRVIRLNDDNYRISARLEQGTAKEILHGKVVINPGSIGGQSKFEQLGDYFKNALQPSEADFGKKKERGGICFSKEGEVSTAVDYAAFEFNLGPALPARYQVNIDGGINVEKNQFRRFYLRFDTNKGSYFNKSIYFGTQPGRSIWIAYAFLFRVKNSIIFMEAHHEHPEGNPDSTLGKTPYYRCYFW